MQLEKDQKPGIDGGFRIKKSDGHIDTVAGPDSCDVRCGALLLFRYDANGREIVSTVYGPGEWVHVN
jgi:hypothetical protein